MALLRRLTLLAPAAALLLAAPALADTVYNGLDNTIDSDLESLALTYDTVNGVGSTGSTTLSIQVDGKPDHPGCNIQGGALYITLAPVVADPTVADVSLSGGGTFDACTDKVTATVAAKRIGSTKVSFEIVDSKTSNDPNLTFSLAEASFTVNVTEAPVQPPVGCDADPAAPAWAAAILKKAGIKPGTKQSSNLVSQIAGEMGPGATFGGFAKNAHPQYENAVQARLQELVPNRTLPTAASAARPGWECAAQG